MLTIHHLGISQSERILWLCDELGVPYNLIKHFREPVLSPKSLQSVPGNETGKAPFIEDPDAGLVLSESGAICEYIVNTYGDGRLTIKPGEKGYADYLYWFHYANGTLQPNMVASMMVTALVKPDDPMGGFAQQRLEAGFEHLDKRLADNKWLAGDVFTTADIMTVYSLTTQRYFGPRASLKPYKNILRYLQDCAARPAYKKAMENGDPEMELLIGPDAPSVGMMQAGGVKSDHWKKSK